MAEEFLNPRTPCSLSPSFSHNCQHYSCGYNTRNSDPRGDGYPQGSVPSRCPRNHHDPRIRTASAQPRLPVRTTSQPSSFASAPTAVPTADAGSSADRWFPSYASILVPCGKKEHMRRILKPFTKHVPGLRDLVEVVERTECKLTSTNKTAATNTAISNTTTTTETTPERLHSAPQYTIRGEEMSAPALALMLFLPEYGMGSAEQLKEKFQKIPWRHHHTIQLQQSHSSSVVGKQEFYFLSRELPLWSVCPAAQNTRRVRFNIFVRRFSAMVEFYRLITGSEMESSKPGFCLFPLNLGLEGDSESKTNRVSSSTTCELSLKRCTHVNPYPLTDAYLTFAVRNVRSLQAILPSNIRCLYPRHYLVHDPDGNALILHDVTPSLDDSKATTPPLLDHSLHKPAKVVDKDSVHSDSIDSGRFSDFDTCSAELDQCMSRLVKVCNLDSSRTSSGLHGSDSGPNQKNSHGRNSVRPCAGAFLSYRDDLGGSIGRSEKQSKTKIGSLGSISYENTNK